ncbi:hypothetical protein [Bacillus alveayuensis]|uniref:hypothetical protein n=1 Tax=Aeribacillus alveayuensis TaxID=279215 RepID=UPI0005D0FED7|nr:hypothetical protein [Bacillus alveayuensis]
MKKRTMIFLFFLVAIIAYGVVRSGFFMNIGFAGHHSGMPMMDMTPHHGHGAFAHHRFPHRGGMMPPNGWMMFGLIPLLFQLAMIIIGWIIWKTANRSRVWKWAGLALIIIGFVALLPKILLIPLALFAVYVMYKQTKRPELSSVITPTMQQRDFLDEWEKKIEKEE